MDASGSANTDLTYKHYKVNYTLAPRNLLIILVVVERDSRQPGEEVVAVGEELSHNFLQPGNNLFIF